MVKAMELSFFKKKLVNLKLFHVIIRLIVEGFDKLLKVD